MTQSKIQPNHQQRQAELNRALSGHVNAARLRALLDQLQASGRITGRLEKTTGRPRTVWRLVAEFSSASAASHENAEKAEERTPFQN